MIEHRPLTNFITYMIMFFGVLLLAGPLIVIALGASQSIVEVNSVPFSFLPGDQLFTNLTDAMHRAHLARAMLNSLVMALLVTFGKIVLSALTAFAIVFFRTPLRHFFFWAVFLTLMLPLEVRVVPTYAVAADMFTPFSTLIGLVTGIHIKLEWNLLNSYTGLTLPLIATATGTFLYRQFFKTIPRELVEAARLDGAGPIRFFLDIVLPLSRSTMLALATIMFVYGWNQYLWPLLMITDPAYKTVMMSLTDLLPSQRGGLPDWNITLAGSLIIMMPPLLLVAFLQRWFVRGLISTDK